MRQTVGRVYQCQACEARSPAAPHDRWTGRMMQQILYTPVALLSAFSTLLWSHCLLRSTSGLSVRSVADNTHNVASSRTAVASRENEMRTRTENGDKFLATFLKSSSLQIVLSFAKESELDVRTQTKIKTNEQTPWALVRERSIPTERPPLVDEI
jgi:hypothetical protein